MGPANNLYVSAFDTGSITGFSLVQAESTRRLPGFPISTPATAGIAAPTSISIDGRQNIWLPNNTNGTDANSNPAGSVSYVSSRRYATFTCYRIPERSNLPELQPRLAVDQAGNVWVAGDGNNFITEFVGAGVPLFQPYAAGMANWPIPDIP